MNRLIKTESAIYKLWMLSFQRISFSLLYPPPPSHTKHGVRGWVYCFQVVLHSVIPWFPLHFHSISWERFDGIWPNFAHALILTRSRLGLLGVKFRKFVTELWPLIDVRISFWWQNLVAPYWCQNFVSARYLENKLMEFDQILHMHWYWQDLGWDCYTSIFTNL